MKQHIAIAIISAAAMTLMAPPGLAQTNSPDGTPAAKKTAVKQSTSPPSVSGNEDNGKGKGKNKPSIAERPTVIPRDPAADSSGADKGKGKPEKPARPDNPALPTEVKSLVTSFQNAREMYLNQQKELRRQLKEATDEQREAIRGQMRESLERWKEQHQQFVKDVKDRAKEMKDHLQPDLGRVIDQGAKENNGRGR